MIFCHQQCNSHHLSQQVCPDVGGQSQVQEQATKKEGVMMDESFRLPVFKPPVSGEPLRALESATLKEPRKAELCPALTCICCLSGTAMKRVSLYW